MTSVTMLLGQMRPKCRDLAVLHSTAYKHVIPGDLAGLAATGLGGLAVTEPTMNPTVYFGIQLR